MIFLSWSREYQTLLIKKWTIRYNQTNSTQHQFFEETNIINNPLLKTQLKKKEEAKNSRLKIRKPFR